MHVEIQRIDGDIYINGEKKVFALDFNAANPSSKPQFENVDWLLGWAKIGLILSGHTVSHFNIRHVHSYGDTQPMVGETHSGSSSHR